MIPIAGCAYTYTYATMGELVAWIIGWDLILEYAFSNMAVSVGFAAHIVDLLDWFGMHPAPRGSRPPICPRGLQDLQGNDIYAAGLALRLQHPRLPDRHAAHRGAGARHPRVGARPTTSWCWSRSPPSWCSSFVGAQLHPSRQLASRSSPNGWSGRAHRRLHHLLHLHRLRFGLHRSRRVPATRSAMCPSASSPRWSSAPSSISAWRVVLTGIVPWQTHRWTTRRRWSTR